MTPMAIRIPRAKSAPEETFAVHLRGHELPCPQREHRFHATRRWRFDFAWPARKIAVEIDGGMWSGKNGGYHNSPAGFAADCEKLNAALEDGWRVYRYTPAQVRSGRAVEQMARVLAAPA